MTVGWENYLITKREDVATNAEEIRELKCPEKEDNMTQGLH